MLTGAKPRGASFCHFVPAHRAGAWRSTRRIKRDLRCPTPRDGDKHRRVAIIRKIQSGSRCRPRAHSSARCPHASSRKHRPPAAHHTRRERPQTLRSSTVGRGLTSWRSAANAPDGILLIDDGWCVRQLQRRVRPAACYESFHASESRYLDLALRPLRPAQARGGYPWNQPRSRCPARAPAALVQARGAPRLLSESVLHATHASGHAHSILAHHAHARSTTPPH
jgi:hypothetical protein